MSRLLLVIAFFLISLLTYGQKETKYFDMRIGGKPVYPELILKIDTINIKLDSLSIKKINPNWIKRVEVLKDEQSKNLYKNKDGVVFIYTKKRFRKKILKLFKSE